MVMGHKGHREPQKPADNDPAAGSPAYLEWLRSKPQPGEAFGDTGLASAADCRKLQWSPDRQEEALLSKLIESAVERDRNLFKSGSIPEEAKRINNLAADALIQAGLDPKRFGVSMPGTTPESTNLRPANGGS